MNLDFRKLEHGDQIKAVENVIKLDSIEYLAFLISKGKYDVYSWFSFSRSIEGDDYWFNLKEKVKWQK
jgi:hypothetical protein